MEPLERLRQRRARDAEMSGEPGGSHGHVLVEMREDRSVAGREVVDARALSLMAGVTRKVDLRKRDLDLLYRLTNGGRWLACSQWHAAKVETPGYVRQNEQRGAASHTLSEFSAPVCRERQVWAH